MNVSWSERALAEFADAAVYVAREFGQQTALKMRASINEAILSIMQFPQIGKVCFSDEELSIDFRELVVKLSSVIYVIHEEEIYIVTEDRHYDVLREVEFPKVDIIGLDEAMKIL